MELTIRGVQVSSSNQTCLPKVGFYLLPMNIKLPLTAVNEFNMKHNEPVLCGLKGEHQMFNDKWQGRVSSINTETMN